MKITTKNEALNIVEPSYLASLSSLLWVALYYLPIGGGFIKVDLTPPNDLIALEKRNSNCIGRTFNTISTFIHNYGSC